MIHAVGRASDRAPRGSSTSPGVGPGGAPVTGRSRWSARASAFDTGGLDIKPASGMLIMKKDMGGAAAVLALGHMAMAAKLDVRLRILIPAAENASPATPSAPATC